jgi:micrococcal nuclease
MKAMLRWWKRRSAVKQVLLVLGVFATVFIVTLIVAIAAPSPEDEPVSTSAATDSTLPFVAVPTTSAMATSSTQTVSSTSTLPPTTITSTLSATTLAAGDHTRVVSVTDGDTIVVVFSDGTEEEVRLIGIDTPETGEDFSGQATQELTKLVGGRTVRLEMDVESRDQYGRLLAYVWVGTVMINEELLRLGLATIYTVPPNVKYVETLWAAQDEAEAAQSGFWGEPSKTPLLIVHVEYDAPGDDSLNLNEEYITFKVLVSGTLLGYSVEDQTGHRYRFPDRVFKKGDVVKLHSGEGTETQTDLYWGASGAAIWNNDGDTVKVLDPQDQIVESYNY